MCSGTRARIQAAGAVRVLDLGEARCRGADSESERDDETVQEGRKLERATGALTGPG